ncbi:methyltransferase domain-containing protein [Streptomyces sp. B6B3]|uniref:class I SAM-dependent methyltransferase n=1 Tax=Streptomyces sp. B6B3 TaxID=3153570 RepID=UPI00325DA946
MSEDPPVIIGDAFGTAAMRCWTSGMRPGVSHEIVERDDGHLHAMDMVRLFGPDPAEWKQVERLACERVEGRILDVGCGPGRHAVFLTKNGHDVLGLEPSSGAAAVARARGVEVVEAAVLDARDIGTFDTVVMLGNNLGLLGGHEQGRAVLARLARLAAPGAQVLACTQDPSSTDPDHLAYQERNRRRGRLPGQLRMRYRDRRLATPWFDYLLATPDDVRATVADTDWVVAAVERHGSDYLIQLRLRG